MMTSAEIVIEFVKGRPDLEQLLRKKMSDWFRAPEAYAPLCAELVREDASDPSDEEKALLDKVRGNGDVDWAEVARAFGAPIDPQNGMGLAAAPEALPESKGPKFDWKKARALGATLVKQSSELSAALNEFEKLVVELDLGVEASVPLDKGSQLLFGKQGSTWGLYVVMPAGVHALRNTSRKFRILAAHQTVALLGRLVEEADRLSDGVREASERLAEAIEIAEEVKRGD